jgi:hypothetical protein
VQGNECDLLVRMGERQHQFSDGPRFFLLKPLEEICLRAWHEPKQAPAGTIPNTRGSRGISPVLLTCHSSDLEASLLYFIMSHSKRNTSLAFFTSYERSLLRTSWGSQSTRLTRDSFLPFASCRLCLLSARDPVACSGGSKADIFCRECALKDLVAQRKEIKRLEREWEDREVENGEDEKFNKEEEAKRELEKFEETALGFEVDGFIVNGRGKKRKAVEVESAEGPDKHKSKIGDEKVDWPLSSHNTYIWVYTDSLFSS